jgi:hypothetical protein
MFAVALTAVALAVSAPVPVSGGTGAERSIIRQALKLVDPGVVASARIDKRRYLVLGRPAQRGPGVRRDRRLWEAQAFVASVMARLAARHHKLAGYAIPGIYSGPGRPRLGPPGADALLAVVFARAGAAGLDVRSSRILPIGGGLLDVVVRLRDDQLLDERAQAAVATLFGPPTKVAVPLHFLSVEAPDGTALAYGGTFASGNSWSYDGDTRSAPVPQSVPQRLAQAPTDLVVRLTRDRGLVRKRTFHIVCGAGAPAAGSRCRRVLADRWALLLPAMGNTCAGSPPGAWNVTISGILAGQRISRAYSGCFEATVGRWTRFLGA